MKFDKGGGWYIKHKYINITFKLARNGIKILL